MLCGNQFQNPSKHCYCKLLLSEREDNKLQMKVLIIILDVEIRYVNLEHVNSTVWTTVETALDSGSCMQYFISGLVHGEMVSSASFVHNNLSVQQRRQFFFLNTNFVCTVFL